MKIFKDEFGNIAGFNWVDTTIPERHALQGHIIAVVPEEVKEEVKNKCSDGGCKVSESESKTFIDFERIRKKIFTLNDNRLIYILTIFWRFSKNISRETSNG